MEIITDEVELAVGTVVQYEIRRSKRAKRASLVMYPDGRLIAKIPHRRTAVTAKRLVNEKKVWILKNYKKAQLRPKLSLPEFDKKELVKVKKEAKNKLTERVEYFNHHYGFKYKDIFVKNHTAQWGSCSSRGNLNFNFRLIFLPINLLDYVVVHELCHLGQMNHSKKFWNLVTEMVPDYKKIEKELGNYILR
jgi:predicted metal-dependent hydrolase